MKGKHLFRRAQHSDNGFTLIEVMIVLALIAILSSITMPSLRGFAASTRLKSSARAVRDMLNFARDMSITERTAYFVVFDFDQNHYWLASSETFNVENPSASSITSPSSSSLQAASLQTTPLRTSTILGVWQEFSQNVSLVRMITNHNLRTAQVDAGVDYIYFSSTGSSEDTTLYIQDRRGKVMSIAVANATGRVHLQELDSQQSEELGLSVGSS
jgi:prepilin-type N-terminal cleavage/methylation domain-containing protein